MTTLEIIMGIIEAFSGAVVSKTNWSRKAAIALLRDVQQSFPGVELLEVRFDSLLQEKTSWGSRQLVHILQSAGLMALGLSLQSTEERICDAQEEVNRLEDELAKAQAHINTLEGNKPAGPSPAVPEKVRNTPAHREYNTSGAMIVAAAKSGWLRDGKVKAKACPDCRTNDSVITFNKGNDTVTKCYVCGIQK